MTKYKRKRTARKPVVVAGVEWLSYQTGVNAYELRSTKGGGAVWRYSHLTVWRATVNGDLVGKRFQYESTALTAASKEINRRAKVTRVEPQPGAMVDPPSPMMPEPPVTRETLASIIHEFISLCALGDTDETTEAYGWGDLIRRAKLAANEVTGGTTTGST